MTTDDTPDARVAALVKHLDCEADDITEENDNRFTVGREEYLVLTDEEADAEVKTRIRDSAWAFNTDFIMGHTKLPNEAEEMVRFFQTEKCEGANDTILALLTDFDDFCEDAVCADGRGHFLAGYDAEENEEKIGDVYYYIYRTN